MGVGVAAAGILVAVAAAVAARACVEVGVCVGDGYTMRIASSAVSPITDFTFTSSPPEKK